MGFFHKLGPQPQPQQQKPSCHKQRFALADATVIRICRDLQQIAHMKKNGFEDASYRERKTFRRLMRYMLTLPPLVD
jgi:hypothetical protein